MRKPIVTIARLARPAQQPVPPQRGQSGQSQRREGEELSRIAKLPEARQKRCQPPVDAAVAILEKAVLPDRRIAGRVDRTELGGQALEPG